MEGRERARSREGGLLLLLVLLAASCGGIRRASALSVTVNDKECVYEYVLFDGDTISGNFVVVDHEIFWGSDHPGIDFEVTSPAGNVVHLLKGTSGDKFEFKAPKAGMYKFCFHNPYSTPETVSFYIHVGHIPNEHDLTKDEHLDPINVKIAELREALESVTAEQRYLKAREARHRHTNESTRRRLIFCTLTEYLALACASGLQESSSGETGVPLWNKEGGCLAGFQQHIASWPADRRRVFHKRVRQAWMLWFWEKGDFFGCVEVR